VTTEYKRKEAKMNHNSQLKYFLGISLLIHATFIIIFLPHILSTGTGGGGNNNRSGHFFEISVAGTAKDYPVKQQAENKKAARYAASNEKNDVSVINEYSAGSESTTDLREQISSISGTSGPGNFPGGGDNNFVMDPFIKMVREKIEKAKNYPEIARRHNWTGEVLLKFLISKTGEVKNIILVKSSGCNILDNSAINTVKNAAPFAPRPELLLKDDILVSLPVVFSLQ
jgi:periplasmic protein TonB